MRKFIRLIFIALGLVVLSFVVWLGYASTHYTVPIIMYHYINDEEPQRSGLGVSPKVFERQMCFLRKHKYNILPLEELADLIRQKKKIPPKTIAITIDDGYYDNYVNAFPILKKYSIPATIFVVTGRIGKVLGNDQYMDWQQIKEISESGLVTIGSHSLTHSNLTEMRSDDGLMTEIFESRRILKEALNKEVNLFSYPFGGVDPRARAYVIEAGYKAAVGTNFPDGYPDDDIYALKRIRIAENAGNLFIFWVETSGYYTFIKEQRDKY